MEAGGIPVQVRYCESQIHKIFRRCGGFICGNRILP